MLSCKGGRWSYGPLISRAIATKDDDERGREEEVHDQHAYESGRLDALPESI